MDSVIENFSKAHVQKAIGKTPWLKSVKKNVILSDDEGFIQLYVHFPPYSGYEDI